MTEPVEPIPMRLHCPECHELHLDVGEYATKPHSSHACQHCGNVWRPAVVPTVGVRFLPGFKNDDDQPAESLRDRAVVFDPDDRSTWPPTGYRVQVWPWSDPTARFEAFFAAQVGRCWLEVGGAVHPLGGVAIWAPLGLELDTEDVWEYDSTVYPETYRPKVQP